MHRRVPDGARVVLGGRHAGVLAVRRALQAWGIEPDIDWIIGNYRGGVRRTNGNWLSTRYRINAYEYRHTAAEYPLGHSDGSGNIGFPDNPPTVPVT